MRLTGAMLLTAAGFLAGLMAAGELRSKAMRREELCRTLALIEFELARFHTPLPELFKTISAQAKGPGAMLCRRMGSGLESLGERDFSKIWEDALDGFPARERAILLPLGQVLGRYGTEEQLRAVTACRHDMEQAFQEARAAAREKGRIYVGLSAAGGAVLSVLLL